MPRFYDLGASSFNEHRVGRRMVPYAVCTIYFSSRKIQGKSIKRQGKIRVNHTEYQGRYVQTPRAKVQAKTRKRYLIGQKTATRSKHVIAI